MKKREASSKSLKTTKTTSPSTKKTTNKSKSSQKQPRKQKQYLILGNEVYVASTQTERYIFQQFQKKVKNRSASLKKASKKSSPQVQPINLKQYVKSLSKAEKQRLFHDLQKQIEQQKEQVQSEILKPEYQLGKINAKIQKLREQLVRKWEVQVNQINHLFQNEQISLQEKNEKTRLLQKIRNNKFSMLDHISILFTKILFEDKKIEANKPEEIQQIMNSLGSMNSFQSLCHNNEVPLIEMANSPFESQLPPITKSFQKEKKAQSEEQIQEYEEIKRQFFHQQSPNVIKSEIESNEIVCFNKENLKLDIRLDQVQFGKDHYEEELIQDKQFFQKIESNIPPPNNNSSEIESISIINNEEIEKKKLQQEFLCREEPSDSKLKIPLLMTKDRIQQIQLQKSAKQKQILVVAVKHRTSYQLSEIIPQNTNHFTTLIDINTFVVSFYEFLMHRFLKEVIEGLNLAYGKSSTDKLFQLRNQGIVSDIQNNVLMQQMLDMFQKEISLSVRKLSEYQKYHNMAVFNAFNNAINVYRPYYELQGDVFPWNTSQKGLTFYEINDENIEEVFEKSKMKVLEFCTNLCGIMPSIDLSTPQSKRQLQKRNEQSYQKVLKHEINQKFGDWYIKVLNFQAVQRLSIYNQILQHEMDLFIDQLQSIVNN